MTALIVVQLGATLGLFAVLFFGATRAKGLAYGLVAGIVILELAQAMAARAALQRAPSIDHRAIYASRPLGRSQQRLVWGNLIITTLTPLMLTAAIPTTSFKHGKLVELLLLMMAAAPSWISLWRVLRHNSWLAVSRIPARPRRRVT